MGKRASYSPGTFSWIDLATTDPADAKRFYGGLFNWELEDMPAGEGMTYTMARLDGDYVAALYEPPEEQRTAGVPPNWVPYFATDSVDATQSRAEELGGSTLVPAMEIPTGKFAGLRDPQGAPFSVFEGDFDD